MMIKELKEFLCGITVIIPYKHNIFKFTAKTFDFITLDMFIITL